MNTGTKVRNRSTYWLLAIAAALVVGAVVLFLSGTMLGGDAASLEAGRAAPEVNNTVGELAAASAARIMLAQAMVGLALMVVVAALLLRIRNGSTSD